MPEKNLCKKGKSIYTEMVHKENSDRLDRMRRGLKIDAKEQEEMDLEREYLIKGTSYIQAFVANELEKRIARVESDKSKSKGLGRMFRDVNIDVLRLNSEKDRLYVLDKLWKDTNSRLKLAFDVCTSVSELREASDRICELVSMLSCKDIRTYNMMPVWENDKQTMVLNLAVQNYELILDDYLNKLGSKGMAKLGDITERNYTKREELDAKLDKAVLDFDKNKIIKSLKEGAYVDLKLESDRFSFKYKPCTLFNYLLIEGKDDLAIDVLEYGADVNIKNMMDNNSVFLPIVYALERGNTKLTIAILEAGAILDKNFIGRDIKDLFRKVLGVSKRRSSIKKLSRVVIEEAYINDLISIDEIKEALNEDENKMLMRALNCNNDVLISKLLSSGARLKKDEELTGYIERYLDYAKEKEDFGYFAESYRFLNIPGVIRKEEIITGMYLKGLLSVDRIIDVYRKNKQYILDKILKLGGDLLIVDFLKSLVEKNKFDVVTAKSLEEYIRKNKNEDLLVDLYINGIIPIDVVSDVLGKDITYFFGIAKNKGNDILMGKLLDVAPSVCKTEKEMKAILKLVKDYLQEDADKIELPCGELINKVNEYEKLIIRESSYLMEREVGNRQIKEGNININVK